MIKGKRIRIKESDMKKTTQFIVIAGLLTVPSLVGAACVKAGYVDRVTTMPGNKVSSIYVRDASTRPFLYRYTTKDAKLIDAALSASTSRTRVMAKGTAATCPAAGNVRNAGGLVNLVLAP